jgi:hypothetical protein
MISRSALGRTGSSVAKTVDVQRAVMRSTLPAPARLIVFALCARADYKTGVVPDEHTPSLTDLCRDTGLSRSAVATHLNTLETLGWVDRERPEVVKARTEGARTGYRVAPGASPGDGLVQETDQAPPSAGDGLDLVQETDQPSPSGGLVKEETSGLYSTPTKPSHSQPARAKPRASTGPPKSDPKPAPKAKGTRLPADFELTDEMIAWARENTPLCNRTDHDAFVDYWRAKTGANATKHDWLATWRNWMRREQSQRERYGGRARASPGTDVAVHNGNGTRPSTTDLRVGNGLALADHYDRLDAEGATA